jgi:transcriptional regulator with XRE-family HTH domain
MIRYRLRQLMDARNISANELRRRSGVSGGTIAKLLQGRGGIADTTLERLAGALGVKPAELMAGGEPEP